MIKLSNLTALASLADAIAWHHDSEKFVYCVEKLGIYASANYSDKWVYALEARYEELLGEQHDDHVLAYYQHSWK